MAACCAVVDGVLVPEPVEGESRLIVVVVVLVDASEALDKSPRQSPHSFESSQPENMGLSLA